MKRLFISIILVFSIFSQHAFTDDSSTSNYDDINFPQWAKDLRRTEIITFGSLPFVTLWTIMGYSWYEYDEIRNPLDKSTTSFTEDDQWKIIKISAAACVGLGLTDLTINMIMRARKQSRLRKENELKPYTITAAKDFEKENPPALHEDESDEQAIERLKHEKEMENQGKPEIFIEGVESAIF